MFEQLKAYANLILAVVLLLGLSYSHWYAYSHGKAAGKAEVQSKFDSYRSNINDQVQKAKDEAAIEKQRQDHLYDKAKADYADTARNLDTALKRLRDLPYLSGDSSVPVAGGGGGTVPAETGNTDDITVRLATFEGTCNRDFYEAAMKQTLQCEALINFVK